MNRPISTLALATALAATTFAPAAASAAPNEDQARVTTSAAASASIGDIKPPVAEKRPHSYTYHGITIEDPYDWLYDKSYPTVDDEDVLASELLPALPPLMLQTGERARRHARAMLQTFRSNAR